MKTKIGNFLFCVFLFITLFILIKNNQEVASILNNSVSLFFKRVFPTLFPMFIINDLMIYANIPYYFYLVFNKLFTKLFHIRGIGAYIMFMSLISGTPTSGYLIKNLYLNKIISLEEANHYLYFTYFANPLFLSLILSLSFKASIVLKIILIHYLSNIIIAFLMRKKAPVNNIGEIKRENNTLSTTLIKSIKRAISTLLVVLGTIAFYVLLTYIITNILPLNPTLKVLLSGFLEITNGLNNLGSLSILPKLKEIMAIIIISFGGLSINTQIKAILEDTPLDFKCFLKGRIIQAIISGILIIII